MTLTHNSTGTVERRERYVRVRLLNSKNDTWGQGVNGRDIILVRTVDWGQGWGNVCVCVRAGLIRHNI